MSFSGSVYFRIYVCLKHKRETAELVSPGTFRVAHERIAKPHLAFIALELNASFLFCRFEFISVWYVFDECPKKGT